MIITALWKETTVAHKCYFLISMNQHLHRLAVTFSVPRILFHISFPVISTFAIYLWNILRQITNQLHKTFSINFLISQKSAVCCSLLPLPYSLQWQTKSSIKGSLFSNILWKNKRGKSHTILHLYNPWQGQKVLKEEGNPTFLIDPSPSPGKPLQHWCVSPPKMVTGLLLVAYKETAVKMHYDIDKQCYTTVISRHIESVNRKLS